MARRKLPPYVVAVRGKAGLVRYRSWFPLGSDGRKKWLPTVATPEEASALRAEAMKLSAALPTNLITVGRAVEATRQELEATTKPDTVVWFDLHAARLLEQLGADTPLQALSPLDIERQVRDVRTGKRGKPLSPTTIQHRKRALSRVLRLALRRGWILTNPLDKTHGWPKLRQKRMAFLTPTEVADVLRKVKDSGRDGAAEDHDVIALAFLTGLRRSELARLRVEDVDLKRRSMFVSGKRADESAAVGDAAAKVLERMLERRPDGGYLIEGGATAVATIFRRWADRLRLPKLTPHALRHGFVSALVEAGHDLGVVQRYARHRTVSMTARYFHSSKKDRDVLSALDGAVES